MSCMDHVGRMLQDAEREAKRLTKMAKAAEERDHDAKADAVVDTVEDAKAGAITLTVEDAKTDTIAMMIETKIAEEEIKDARRLSAAPDNDMKLDDLFAAAPESDMIADDLFAPTYKKKLNPKGVLYGGASSKAQGFLSKTKNSSSSSSKTSKTHGGASSSLAVIQAANRLSLEQTKDPEPDPEQDTDSEKPLKKAKKGM